MKPSAYNTFVYYPDDEVYIGFNCVTGGLYAFNEEQFNTANRLLSQSSTIGNDAEKEIQDKLLKGRFLIDDDINEREFLKLRNNMSRYNPYGMGIVITPTLECNFDCPYCYVDRDKTPMTPESISAVKSFFKKKMEKTDSANICWTGGEPLLNIEIIEEINYFLVEEAQKKSTDFSVSFSMNTNGYLLTPEIIERLKAAKISSLQITVDGFRDFHDRLRFTRGGKGTYQKIMENVVMATNRGMKVNIRSNIDKDNYQSVLKFIDKLAASGCDKKYLNFSPCKVQNVTTNKGSYKGNCYTVKEFACIESQLLLYSIKKGFKVSKEILSSINTFCGANTLSLYVIDSHANILKCWCNLGRADENKIGYLNKDGDIVYSGYKNLVKWMAWDPFEIPECSECKVLPLCMGGCMYYNIMGEVDSIGVGCSTRKLNLKEILVLFYLSQMKTPDELKKINEVNELEIHHIN